jgi:hypothetical protein
MAKAETPCEEKFLKALDEYGRLMPGHEHLYMEKYPEMFQRAIAQTSTEELRFVMRSSTRVLSGIAEAMEGAISGELRHHWVECVPEVVKSMKAFFLAIVEEVTVNRNN